jgi:hypothetical protein
MAGSDVTFANAFAQLGKVAKILDENQKFGSANTPNLLDMFDSLVTSLDGEFTPGLAQVVRQQILIPAATGLTRQNIRAMFRLPTLELLRAIGSKALTPDASVSDAVAWREIRQYMEDNAQLIKSRNLTFDTSATGSTTGTGAVSRLTVDKDANNLECTGIETKTFECVRDQNNGATKHAEAFEFQFGDADVTGLQWVGTGGVLPVTSLNAKSSNLVVNPSFEQGATANNTALSTTGQITGWDVGTAGSWKTYSAAAYVYRGYQNDTGVTHYGLECTTSDTITQVLRAENPGATFSEDVPYHCQIAWQRKGSATGTLTLHLGAQSTSVDISTGTNDQWNVLEIDLDSSRYYQNFKEGDLDLKVQVASLATGTVVIDDFVLAPMVNLDGTWWALTGGATPWLRGDLRIFSGDSQGASTILNYWLWRAYGDLVGPMRGWFPSTTTASSIVIAEPT